MSNSRHYRWEHREKNRYYRALLAQDLFGDWVVTRIWGGINQSTGRIRHTACQSETEGVLLLQQIEKTRLARGYILCSS